MNANDELRELDVKIAKLSIEVKKLAEERKRLVSKLQVTLDAMSNKRKSENTIKEGDSDV